MQRAYIIWLDIARLRKLWDDEAGIFVFVQFCVGRPTFNAGPRPWCGIAGSLTALCAGSGGWMVKIGFDFCSVQIAIPQGHAPMNAASFRLFAQIWSCNHCGAMNLDSQLALDNILLKSISAWPMMVAPGRLKRLEDCFCHFALVGPSAGQMHDPGPFLFLRSKMNGCCIISPSLFDIFLTRFLVFDCR